MNLVLRTKRYLRTIKNPSPAKTPSTSTTTTKPFPFLSLPPEIRIQIYKLLLVPAFNFIDILWFSKKRSFSILQANKQIHEEASQVFYTATLLYMGSVPGLGLPFPRRPLRRISPVPSLGREKPRARDLKPEVFARFRRIRINWHVGRMDHPGRKNQFTRRESAMGIRGLKEVLRALATAATSNQRSYCSSDSQTLSHRTDPTLYISLDWLYGGNVTTADAFEAYWRREGVWDALARVHKVRRVVLGGNAYKRFRRDWIQLLT